MCFQKSYNLWKNLKKQQIEQEIYEKLELNYSKIASGWNTALIFSNKLCWLSKVLQLVFNYLIVGYEKVD